MGDFIAEAIVVLGSIGILSLFIWFYMTQGFDFHLGFCAGLGLGLVCMRVLHGYWIGDPRHLKRDP